MKTRKKKKFSFESINYVFFNKLERLKDTPSGELINVGQSYRSQFIRQWWSSNLLYNAMHVEQSNSKNYFQNLISASSFDLKLIPCNYRCKRLIAFCNIRWGCFNQYASLWKSIYSSNNGRNVCTYTVHTIFWMKLHGQIIS